MNKIEVFGWVRKFYKDLTKKVADDVLKIMGQPDGLEVAISYVSKYQIKKLNRQNRGIEKVTDVLSFPSTEIKAGEILDVTSAEIEFLKTDDNFIHFGDMALCLSQCKKQAKEYGVAVKDEVKKLVIHSMLHLMGYDHIEDDDYDVMNKKELELEKLIKV